MCINLEVSAAPVTALAANVVPSTILLDRAGRVAAVYVAAVPEDDLRTAPDQLLGEG